MAMMGCRGLRLRSWSGEAEGMVLNCKVGKKKRKFKKVLMDGQRGRLKSVGEKDMFTHRHCQATSWRILFLASIQIFSNTSFLFGKRPVGFQVLFSFPSKTQNAYKFVSIKRCWEAVQLLLEI